MTLNHLSQYDPGASAVTRREGCVWTSLANGIYDTTGGTHHPTPDQIHALLPRSQETNPATPGWSLEDAAKAAGRYGMAFVVHSGSGWSEVRTQHKAHYVLLQGDSDQFGGATCSGNFDGDHCIGIHPRSKVENGVSWWWIDDPICPTARWEREAVLRRYAADLSPSIRFGAFLTAVPKGVWKWTCRPTGTAKTRSFRQFHLDASGRIDGWTWRSTAGMSVPCTPKRLYRGAGAQQDRYLVQLVIPGKPRNGWLVSAEFAHAPITG